MADEQKFLALDLGAESGRGEIVTLADGKVSMEEIHRWPNRPVRMAGTLHWDFPFLFAEVLEAIGIAARRGEKLASISIDTWGVDFGLLGAHGGLLANPTHYRDNPGEGIYEYSNPRMPTGEIFARTGYEPWPLASLFQLLALQRADSPVLAAADAFLNMPDLFNYFLTGQKRNEMSILNTSNLLSTDGTWCEEVISRFGLLRGIFGEIVEPGTVIGPLSPDVAEQTGLAGDVPVIATCGHDTSAAVAAVPGEGEDWAYLSSGTWSILGCMLEAPIATPQCLELGFTNEYTYGGWYLGRNILGLWLVQELKRKWDTPGDPWDYPRLEAAAAEADSGPLVDAAHESLMAPPDMEGALLALIRQTGQPEPAGRGQLVRCVLESLALEYARRLASVDELTGRKRKAIYLVGGGSHNRLLCRLTANACGVPVHAGADQCTALGNALGQALALGILKSTAEIRDVMRASSEIVTYEPQEADRWGERRRQYARLAGA